MSTLWLTLYILVWPVITFGTLAVVVGSFVREWRAKRKEGQSII